MDSEVNYQSLTTSVCRLALKMNQKDQQLTICLTNFAEGKEFSQTISKAEEDFNSDSIEEVFEIFKQLCQQLKASQPSNYEFGKEIYSQEEKDIFIKIEGSGKIGFSWFNTIGKKKKTIEKSFQLNFVNNVENSTILQQRVKMLEQKCRKINVQLERFKIVNATLEKEMQISKEIMLNKLEEVLKDNAIMKEQLKSIKEQIHQRSPKISDDANKAKEEHFNKNFVDSESKYCQKFKIQDDKIKMTGGSISWFQLLMRPVIDPHRIFSFKLKVLTTYRRYIMIGIVDRERKQEKNSSCDVLNMAGYYGDNGCIYPEGINEGNGFKEGDIIQAVVHLEADKIQWKVNDKVEATSKKPQTGEQFVPYIQMVDSGDTIQWLGGKYLS